MPPCYMWQEISVDMQISKTQWLGPKLVFYIFSMLGENQSKREMGYPSPFNQPNLVKPINPYTSFGPSTQANL